MKKIIVIFLSLVLVLGITSMAFAVTEDEEPVKVKSAAEAVEDQIVIEEPIKVAEEETESVIEEEPIKVETETESVEAVKEEEPVEVAEEPIEIAEEETVCPHMWGEWYYDLIEYEDGSTTYFRTCECGAYEELEYQKWSDLGGQYEDCDKGRHYWCEEKNIRYCEECEYIEESII